MSDKVYQIAGVEDFTALPLHVSVVNVRFTDEHTANVLCKLQNDDSIVVYKHANFAWPPPFDCTPR